MDKINKNNISKENCVVLVTASGLIKSACNYDLAVKDPGFLNIGTLLAIDEIKKSIDLKIFLAVNSNNNCIYSLNPYKQINVIATGETNSIIETIENALKFINSDWILINPITSIPSTNYTSGSFIEFGERMLPRENWSAISLSKNGEPIFYSKSDSASEGELSYPFTGRILAKKKKIVKAINKLSNSEKKDLLNLAKELYFEKEIDIKYSNWLDIGHVSTYPLTRISSISSRFFNVLTFNEEENVIQKRSDNKSKISDEIAYYETIPDEIKRYFPTIINVEENKEYSSYEMEYICKPNLSEIYLFSKVGPNAIERIFLSIERIFKTFYKHKPYIIENGSWLYSEKTIKRQLELENIIENKNLHILNFIYNNDFSINNLKLPSLKKSFTYLNEELLKFENNRPFHLGHGDLCFNNILIDPNYGEIKLIDPRANKHLKIDKYGLIDNFYDISKLNHSIEGLYDSIVNNLFNLRIQEKDDFCLEIFKPLEYELFNFYFKEIILKRRISHEELKILTGNLFLSMLPLHLDDKKRMIALALVGSIFINDKSINEIFI